MVIHKPPPDFTWLEFGQNAIGWLAGGAAGGAVECALVGTPVGAACGALVGAAGGLAAGSAYYLATVGYNALIGDGALPVAAPAHALD